MSRLCILILFGASFLPLSPAGAQVPGILGGPEETRPELPSFTPEPGVRGTILPPAQVPDLPGTGQLAGGLRIELRAVRFEGATVFSREELDAIAAPYTRREVTIADLEMLRDEVTLAYVERGYATSGAVLPEQEIVGGAVTILCIEGRLEAIVVETDGRFRAAAIRERIRLGDGPVNVYEIERELELLQQDRRIRAVDAELVPSETRGLSILRVGLREGRPYRARAFADNHRAPSVGSYQGSLEASVPNVTGFGDRFEALFSATEGMRRITALYEFPLPRWRTTWDAHMEWSDAEVVDGPFESLDISSSLLTVGSSVRYSFYHSPRTELSGFVTGEWRRSKSYLFGSGFPFSPGTERDGEAIAMVLRAGLDVAIRTRRQAFAGRTRVSRGIDVLDATIHAKDVPDGEFWSWLTQLQYAVRLPWLGAQVVSRLDLQLADRPLLAMEQLTVGGYASVRGYRENQVVGDNGVIGSLELRIPVWLRSEGQPVLELAPFFDAGHSWSEERFALLGKPAFDNVDLFGVGIGARFAPTDWLRANVYWAKRLNDTGYRPGWDLQDSSIYFEVTTEIPE